MTFKDKPKRPGGKPVSRDRKPNFGSKPAFSEKKREFEPRKSEAPVVSQPGAKPERISKIMARAGVASRRDVEKMIMEGRVSLNGVVLESPAINATLNDKIEVDGEPIRGAERTRLWIYHKPAGLVTTNNDPEGRPTVFQNLPEELPRVLSIGRLDINTEGLLLLTNDGGLSRVLELPTTGWLRRYRVRAYGEVDQAKLDTLKEGIAVDGVLYGAIDATLDRQQGHNVWISMGLREGKNREIKNVLGALGLEVNRLIRVSYGPFQLGDLPEGKVIEVRGRMLRDQLGPRLIEASGANFDAPLYNDVSAEDEADAAPRAGAKPARDGRDSRDGADRPRGRRDDDARSLDRWSTSKPSRDAGRGAAKGRDADDGEERRPKRPGPGFGSKRPANVWIAPGGRPTTEPVKAKRPGTVEKDRSLKSSTPEEHQKRVKVNRVAGDRDWIRADETPSDDRGGRGGRDGDERRGGKREDRGFSRGGDRPQGDRKPFGDKPRGERSFGDKPRGDRPFGDRPPRGEGRPEGDRKPYGDKPRGERSFGDKPRGDRPFGDRPPRGEGRPQGDRKPYGDKPRGERSFGDKPRGDRPFGDRPPRGEGRPQGDRKPFGDKPRGERSFGDKPRGDRPFGDRPPRGEGRPEGDRKPSGDKPRGERSFGDKPRGDKPFGGKPSGGKPSGGRPSGDKPSGGRPAGGKGMSRNADRRR